MPQIYPHAKLRVRRGRSLVFSPAWAEEGASVLFDRNSGDYWVLTAQARCVVSAVADAGTLPCSTLAGLMPISSEPPGEPPVTAGDIDAILNGLMQAGILTLDDGSR